MTGHGNGLKFMRSATDSKVKSPTVIAKISENTDSDLYYGKRFKSTIVFEDDGEKISTGSIGIISLDGKIMAIGGVMNSGIWVCEV